MSLNSLLIATLLVAQTAVHPDSNVIRIKGKDARSLISLLVSGNATIRYAVHDLNKKTVLVYDLSILSEASYKYDVADPYYRLEVYSATAKIDPGAPSVRIGEANALYHLLSRLGVTSDTALEGTYLAVKEIKCTIDTKSLSIPARFQCDLTH